MEHHFDIEVAQQVKVEKAILLYNLDFWTRKNKANDDHFHDGRTWTYNSGKAFAELFPYMKEKSIARWLRELEKDGFLVSSQKYNQNSYDKTKWYSLLKKYYSIAHFEQPKEQNEQSLKGADNKPDNKHTPYSPSQGGCVVDKSPRAAGTNPRATGSNPRAIGTNPRATGTNPRNKVVAASSDNGKFFERFWTEYPRKVGKQKCRQIWKRLKPSVELTEQIITKVKAYKRTEQWQKDNGEFIPHPATWLNQGRWEDEIAAKPEPKKGDPDWLPTEGEVDELFRDTGLIK